MVQRTQLWLAFVYVLIYSAVSAIGKHDEIHSKKMNFKAKIFKNFVENFIISQRKFFSKMQIFFLIGIAIGALLTTGSNADTLQVPNVILQGLATGTLLYVIFFEVLSKDRSGLLPYLSVFGGFLIMFGLQYIGEHS